jgi:hypothetical protein
MTLCIFKVPWLVDNCRVLGTVKCLIAGRYNVGHLIQLVVLEGGICTLTEDIHVTVAAVRNGPSLATLYARTYTWRYSAL